MTRKEEKWLRDEFVKYMELTLMPNSETLYKYYEAQRLLNGWSEVRTLSCPCDYRYLKTSVNIMWNNKFGTKPQTTPIIFIVI